MLRSPFLLPRFIAHCGDIGHGVRQVGHHGLEAEAVQTNVYEVVLNQHGIAVLPSKRCPLCNC